MGFSEAAFTVEEQRLKEKWGVDPSPNDTFKSMTEHAVLEAMKRNDFSVRLFFEEGKPGYALNEGSPIYYFNEKSQSLYC